MTDLEIRRANVNDLPACADIINNYIDKTNWLPRLISPAELNSVFSPELLSNRFLAVAAREDGICGYLSLDENTNKIGGLYVAPDYQCIGIGKALLDAAKIQSSTTLNLTVFEPNIHAKRFYEREGFVEVPEERDDDTEEGVPTLMMLWKLRK